MSSHLPLPPKSHTATIDLHNGSVDVGPFLASFCMERTLHSLNPSAVKFPVQKLPPNYLSDSLYTITHNNQPAASTGLESP